MALFEHVHPRRVDDARAAAALFRALGCDEVYVQGWNTTEPRDQDRLCAAFVPGSDSTLTFRGVLDRDALATLVGDEHGYLDVSAGGMHLRVWPDHAWVYGDHEQQLETDGADALRVFRDRTTGGALYGYLMHAGARGLAAMPAFLRATRSRLEANLRLAPEAAAALADIAFDELWWQNDTHVRFPDGAISAYHTGTFDEAAWDATIDRALAR